MKKLLIYVLCFILTIGVIYTCGCLSLKESAYPQVSAICAKLNLSYDKVSSTNFTRFKENLTPICHKVSTDDLTDSVPGWENGIYMWIGNISEEIGWSENTLCIVIASANVNSTKTAYMEISYYNPHDTRDTPITNKEQEELNKAKQFMKNMGNEITEICNLTLDWDNAKWTVYYVD